MVLGFPSIVSSFDSDARTYVKTSGATATAEINHFVKAIKRLGLWNSMVCWPLRSSQNAGTGTTAYSLGGLGTYNGTLVNGPTWGMDGVRILNNRISFPAMSDFSSGIFTGSIHKVTNVSSNNRGISFTKSSVNPYQVGGMWTPFSDTKIYWDCLDYLTPPRAITLSGASNNVFYMWSGTSNGGQIILNKTSLFSGGSVSKLTGVFDIIEFGANVNIPTFDGTVSFVFIIKIGVALPQIQMFYDIYNSTLGQGLGLP